MEMFEVARKCCCSNKET